MKNLMLTVLMMLAIAISTTTNAQENAWPTGKIIVKGESYSFSFKEIDGVLNLVVPGDFPEKPIEKLQDKFQQGKLFDSYPDGSFQLKVGKSGLKYLPTRTIESMRADGLDLYHSAQWILIDIRSNVGWEIKENPPISTRRKK